MPRHVLIAALLAALASSDAHASGARRPADLALITGSGDRSLAVVTANEAAGSVSRVSASSGAVEWELLLAPEARPSALEITPDGRWIVGVERRRHRAFVIRIDGSGPELLSRAAVGRLPTDLVCDPDGRRAWVACEGEGRVVELDLLEGRVGRRIPALEGARRLAWVSTSPRRLAVAGRHGVVEVSLDSGRVERDHSSALAGALNIDGLAVEDGRLIVAHQVQPAEVVTDPQMIVWGLILANRLTILSAGASRSSAGEVSTAQAPLVIPLDQRHRANGDPGRLVVLPASGERGATALLPSGGTGRLVAVDLDGGARIRGEPLSVDAAHPSVAVGPRPVAVVADAAGREAYVLSALDDRIDVVDVPAGRVVRSLRLGPPPAATEAHLGALIFHDSRRSRGGWYSCQSCHPEGGTRGHRFDTHADGDGLAKRAPALHGVEDTGPWAWSAKFERLDEQIAATLHRTMAVDHPPTAADVRRVAAFLATLERPDPSFPGEDLGGDPARGEQLFSEAGCDGCHRPPTFAGRGLEDVGVVDPFDGTRRFDPPSLRGVRDRHRWLHDGRADSLRSVFSRHDEESRHGRAHELSPQELDDLLAFLRTL